MKLLSDRRHICFECITRSSLRSEIVVHIGLGGGWVRNEPEKRTWKFDDVPEPGYNRYSVWRVANRVLCESIRNSEESSSSLLCQVEMWSTLLLHVNEERRIRAIYIRTVHTPLPFVVNSYNWLHFAMAVDAISGWTPSLIETNGKINYPFRRRLPARNAKMLRCIRNRLHSEKLTQLCRMP